MNLIDPPFAAAIRHALSDRKDVEEKWIFGGLWFLVDGKLCIWVRNDELLFRIDPALHDEVLEKEGTRELIRSKRPVCGYVYVDTSALQTKKKIGEWIKLALDFNPRAKTAKSTVARRRK